MNFWADPYPSLARVRSLDPVLWDESLGSWLVTGHEAASQVLRSRSVTSSWRELSAAVNGTGGVSEVDDLLAQWFMLMDGAEHRDRRHALAPAFSARTIADLRAGIDQEARRLLDGFDGLPQVEVVDEYAGPLAAESLALALGLDAATCRASLPHLSALASYLARPDGDDERARAGDAAAELRGLLGEQPPPAGSPLGTLAEDTDGIWVPTATLMLFAGQETTIGLLSSSMLHVLEQRLLPELAGGGLHAGELAGELARYDTSVPQVPRLALRSFDLGRHRVRAGQRLILFLSGANRDPDHHPDPDMLDPTRSERSLAFGAGPHVCLGSHLARLTLRCTLEAWAERLPQARLADDGADWYTATGYRGLRRLIVRTGK